MLAISKLSSKTAPSCLHLQINFASSYQIFLYYTSKLCWIAYYYISS
jgi:hypothetical protein